MFISVVTVSLRKERWIAAVYIRQEREILEKVFPFYY